MSYTDGNYLTEKGRALLAKLMASKSEIKFTRAAVGAGTIPEDKAPKEMTDLVNWQVDGVISDISTPVAGEAQLVFQVFSRDVAMGFLATEAAIWAEDPDEGEILYTYVVLVNTPEWIRAMNDPVQKFAEFTCINIIGAVTPDLTAVNPEAIATLEYLKKTQKQHEDDPNAHQALIQKLLDDKVFGGDNITKLPITIPSDGWRDIGGVLAVDIEIAGITENMVPFIMVSADNQLAATLCGMRSYCQTMNNAVRLFSETAPKAPFYGELTLLVPSDEIGGTSGGGVILQPATSTRLGGVKIGENISVKNDGTISVSNESLIETVSAPEADVKAAIDGIFDK